MGTHLSEVEALLAQTSWHDERRKLRAILLECGLSEGVKWGKLCYAHQGANIAIIYGLKTYCAIGFFKGVLLDDPDGLLVAPGQNSQSMRQFRFRNMADITGQVVRIHDFAAQAIAVEMSGRTVEFTQKDNLVLPEELVAEFDADPDFAAAFDTLTPGRQRGYVLQISQAKQSQTRLARVHKFRPRILAGKGLSDR